MTNQTKIEKKGYKVTFNMGYKNGRQTITSVTAIKGNTKVSADNVTRLIKKIN